jgi:thiol-disulfide isomerase/thioredoxin
MKPSSIVPACLGIVLAAGLASASAGTPVTPVHPALTIKTLDGGSFDLAAKRGNWVIVNFWATWCSP